MNIKIEKHVSCEIRAVIRFLNAKYIKPVEIHKQIVKAYGEDATSLSEVRKLCKLFDDGKATVHGEKRNRSPSLDDQKENENHKHQKLDDNVSPHKKMRAKKRLKANITPSKLSDFKQYASDSDENQISQTSEESNIDKTEEFQGLETEEKSINIEEHLVNNDVYKKIVNTEPSDLHIPTIDTYILLDSPELESTDYDYETESDNILKPLTTILLPNMESTEFYDENIEYEDPLSNI